MFLRLRSLYLKWGLALESAPNKNPHYRTSGVGMEASFWAVAILPMTAAVNVLLVLHHPI